MQDAICNCKECGGHRINVSDVEAPFGVSQDFKCKDCGEHKGEAPKSAKKKDGSK